MVVRPSSLERLENADGCKAAWSATGWSMLGSPTAGILLYGVLLALWLWSPTARAAELDGTSRLSADPEAAGCLADERCGDEAQSEQGPPGPCVLFGRSEPSSSSSPGSSEGTRLAVPICLIEGASGIAPLLVHEVDGGRIDPIAPCGESATTLSGAVPTDGSDLPGASGDSQYAGALGSDGTLPRRPPGPVRVLPQQPATTALPVGFALRVYRPPRG